MPGPLNWQSIVADFKASGGDVNSFAGDRLNRPDPASLTRYGSGAREHPGAPPPRPDERPWVGKAKGRKR